MEKAVVVLSGGQDSATCLWYAKSRGFELHALTFNYGQRHHREVEAAQTIGKLAGVASHEFVPLGPVLKGRSPLVNPEEQVGQYQSTAELPGGIEPTFIPARNILFLTLAANRAAVIRASHVFTGVCEADYGGYPDCRQDFISKMEVALAAGIYGDQAPGITIATPLMTMSKAGTVLMMERLGPKAWDSLGQTHTCYRGDFPPCGKCHACLIRARGFYEASRPDPLIVRAIEEGYLPKTHPPHGLLEVVSV